MVTLTELTQLQQDVRRLHRDLAEAKADEMRVDRLRLRCVRLLARARGTDYEIRVRGLIQLTNSAYCQMQYHRQLEMLGVHDHVQRRDAA